MKIKSRRYALHLKRQALLLLGDVRTQAEFATDGRNRTVWDVEIRAETCAICARKAGEILERLRQSGWADKI